MNERLSRIDFVKQKYRLDELCFVDAESNGKRLGHGKLMADDTLRHFVEADPSGTCKYLDWMIFMAGGGQHAMEKSLRLWEGENPNDPNALRNQCHKDFVAEQVAGYTDDNHVPHPPVPVEVAEANWKAEEEHCRFEFLMGDQDISLEEGYGFFRHWPGKDGLYDRIVNTIQFWHNSQQKIAAQNQNVRRAEKLRAGPLTLWSDEDRKFMAEWSNVTELIDLDIYSGWKPREYSQAKARYNTIEALLAPLKGIRKTQILKDQRFERIYEDDTVKVICPLTVGAALEFGIHKWCICNRTDFDKSFEGQGSHHWKTYAEKGPVVFLLFKIPMPAYCFKIAIRLLNLNLTRYTFKDLTGSSSTWVDTCNSEDGFTYAGLINRIETEHGSEPLRGLSADAKALAYGDRVPVKAWNDAATGKKVKHSIETATLAVIEWGKRFDPNRLVADYLHEPCPVPVSKLNER